MKRPRPRVRVNIAGETELRCGHCKEWFPATVEHFYAKQDSTLGLSTSCRVCHVGAVAKTPSARNPAYRSPAEQQRALASFERQRQRHASIERREQERIAEIEARHIQNRAEPAKLAASDLRRCAECKEVYPLDWVHFGTKRHAGDLSPLCFVCRNPNEFGGHEGALMQLQIRKAPVLWQAQEAQRVERALAQDREKEKKYRQSPKGKRQTQVHTQKRRARRRALPDTLTSQQWSDCLGYFGHRCAVCGQPAGMFTTLAQDHWIPISYTGADNPGTVVTNVVPLCHSTEIGMFGCNNTKRDKNAHDWLVETYGARKAKQIAARINAYFDSVRPFKAVS